MTIEEIIKRQKEHLTKAQIGELIQATERYKQLNASNRASAMRTLSDQYRATRRGLQNTGLAGRKGKLISGQEKAARIRANEAYRSYNAGLRQIDNAYAQNRAARMANETARANQLAETERIQAENDKEVARINAEYEAWLRKKKAAEEAYKRQQEELARKQAQQQEIRDRIEEDRTEQSGVVQGSRIQRLAKDKHPQLETSDYARAAQEQAVQRAVNEYQQTQKVFRQQREADAMYDAMHPGSAITRAPHTDDYVMEQKRVENARQLKGSGASDAEVWFADAYGVSQNRYKTVKNENPELIKELTGAIQSIRANSDTWDAILNGEDESHQVKGIGTVRTKAYTAAEKNKARTEKASAYRTLAIADAAMRIENESVRKLFVIDDAAFDVMYAAALQIYKIRVNQAENLPFDNDRVTGESTTATYNRLMAEAAEAFAPYEAAKRLKDESQEEAFIAGTYGVDETLTPKRPDWLKGSIYSDGHENWVEAHNRGWSADDYEKNADHRVGNYEALVNEWSFINGRTALLYTQNFQVTNDIANIGEWVGHAFGGDINRNEAYRSFRRKCESKMGVSSEKMDSLLTLSNLMTDEERARYNTILRDGGAEEADKYFEYLYESVLPNRFEQFVENELASQTNTPEERLLQSIVSIPNNLIQGVSGTIHTMTTNVDDPVAARLDAKKYTTAQAMRGAVGSHYGETGNFLYQGVMSMADSTTVALVGQGIGGILKGAGVASGLATKAGSVLGGSLLGATAYTSAYEEAIQRGLSPEKAKQTALANGINEMLFEAVSLDILVGHFQKGGILKVSKNGFVNWVVNTLVQGGVEGSEEVFTDIANRLWDNRINGVFSEELTAVRKYMMEDELTYKQALQKVNDEFGAQLWESFKAGAFSGGVMGGGATFIGMVQNRTNESLGKGLRQNNRVMNELRNFDYKSEYAQEILTQDKLTNQDVADLFNIMQQELLGRYKSDIQKAVADGKITQEDANLLQKFQENNVQVTQDGKVIRNENGVTAEEYAHLMDEVIPQIDTEHKIQFLDNEEIAELTQAVGGETAAVIEQSVTVEREAERAYRQTIAEIDSDTTLTDEQKAERKEEAKRTRQNARSEARKIADTALTNKKGIGAKLETDGNGTVKVGKGSGAVTYDFSTKDNPGHQTVDSMTATEQSALRIAKIVAASRPDANVKVEAEFVGEHANENGYYDRNTNTIHINMSGDNSVLWTLSHELTHHLANTDTEAYTALRTAIETALKDSKLTTTELENRGFEYDLDRVDPYIAREGNLWDALVAFEREEHGYGKDAEEEVVARCCESFLGFNQFVKDFAHKQYKSAKAINKFIAQMNIDMQRVSEDARQSAAQRNLWNDESPENQILRQLTEIDRIANLWRIAVNAEAKKRQAAREETRASTKDSVQMENRINKLREEIASIENDSERLFTNGREFDNARLKKLKNELNALIEQERKASVKTSLSDILANLDLYRRSDLISMAGQLTQAWDYVDEMTTQELRDGIREIIEEREYTPLELQAKSRGLWVRPATIASTKDSVNRSDAEYFDLARRYESGDKSVESELRKAVDAAAKAAGYRIKAYHGTYRFGRTKFTSQYGALFLSSNPDVGQAFSGDQPVRAISKQANPDTMDIDEAARWYKQNVHWGEFRVATDADFKHEIERLQPLPESVRQKYHLSEEEEAWKDKALKKVESKYSRFLNGEKFYYFEYNGINNDYANSPFADVNDFRNVVRERLVKNDNGGGVYEMYISPKNMITVDANGAYYASIPLPSELRKYATAEEKRIGKVSSDQLVRIAYEAGYDTLEIKNVVEGGDYGRTAKATDYVVMNPESQAKSADLITKDDSGNIIPLSERFNTKNEDIRYSIRGRVALYSKPGSLDVRDLRDKQGKANLNIAYKMDREGIDSEKIRLATGWFKGYDGKWRSEIDDSEAKLADWLVLGKGIRYMEEKADKALSDLRDKIFSLEDRLKKSNKVNGSDSEQSKALRKELRKTRKQKEEALDFDNRMSNNRLKLSDILDHAKLYENYPQLKDVTVHLTYRDRTGGYLGMATGTSDITLVTDLNSKDEILETLMHEVQHIIQGIEGFAKGANVEYWADRNMRESADLKDAKATLAQVERDLSSVKYEGNPQASPLKTALMYAYITGLIGKETPGTASYAYDTEQKEKYEKRAEEAGYADLLQKYLIAYQDFKIAEMEAKDYNKAFADYRRTAGEVEARDVASRLHMSEDERRATRPDIDRSDVTFFETDRTGEDAWKNEDIRFSMKDNVERKGDLIAVHNLSGDQLLRSIELGGFPMPSIAVIKPSYGHNRYGDVSVIFNKDTIDPKRSSANKVYGGDAWTPTYPSVEYKASKAVRDRVYKKYSELSKKFGYDNVREMYKYAEEIEKQLNSYRGEQALLEHLYDDTDMMRIYQQDAGKNRTDDVYIEDRHEMDKDERELSQKFIDILGEDVVRQYATPKGDNPFEHRREFIKAHRADIEKAWGKILRDSSVDDVQAILDNTSDKDYHGIMIRCLNLLRDGGVRVDRKFDPKATEQAIRKDTDQKAYRKWIDDLFKGAAEKSGIRNTKGYYTESGNPRTWEALHEEETLDNVVRVMRQMSDKASNTIFNQSEMLAIGTRNFKSIDDIRKHKDQLKHISDEEMEAAKTNIVNGFYDLSEELRNKNEKNHFIGRDQALEAMVEAVKKSRTPQGILNELRQWHGLNVTNDMGQRIADLMEEIANLPTEYFEAKPKRAVRIDEIKAVVLPRGEYSELEAKLAENGIPAVEYEKDNDEDRLRALNSDVVSAQRFSKMDKVRLSTSDGTRTYTDGDVTAKLYGNDVELDGGKVRQRVQMMEAIAEVNGTARVDAASEEEAEAFRRAGAEQVVEELEGHGAKYGTWEFKYEERKFTNDSRYDIKQKQKFAKDILKQVGKSSGFTQAQRVKYGAALGRLMDYLWEMQYGKMDGKVIFEFADRLFDSILNDYTALSEADEEFRSELLANMTKTKNAKGSTMYVLEVNDKQMREIKYAYENAMAYASRLSKALGARVTVKQTDKAKTLEDIFTYSTDTRIKSDTNEGAMPGELLRLAQETESRKTNPYAAESEERQALKEGMFDAAMDAAGVEKSTTQQIREAIKETRKTERAKAKTEARKAIDSARLAERMHEGALRAKDRRISENRERALKQHAAEREAKLKQGFRETTQKANETRLKRDMRTIALKWNQRLVKLLANPTEASHVPIQLAREVAELTKTITEYLDSGTERGRINLDKVIKAYQRAFDDQATIAEAQKENPKYDPRGTVIDREMYDEYLVQMMNRMNEIVAEKSFKDLSAYEMKSLLDIVRGVAHTVYDANRLIGQGERRAIFEVGDTMIHQFEDAPDVKLKGYLETSLDLRRLARIFSGSNDNAEFVKLVERLNDGAIEKERIAQVLQDIFAPVTEKYGDEIRKWYGKKAEWIDTGITQNGNKVEITKGMRVSLAMHVLNAGNMNHIANGGITIPNREQYNKGKMTDAYANGETVQLSAEQIEEIISHMTEAEKAYVETAKEFFHKRTGYYVNKTSLQLLGYRKATVENYFPIHTDKNFTKTDFASLQMDGSIEGQGFLKERVNASNPVYLEDITSVVNRQIRGVALYAGLAVPMRNFNAVMNSTEYFEDENGAWRPRTTVRKAMTQKMGEYGAKVVKGFLEDASEMTHVDVTPMERFAGKLATNYVKAVLLGNLKVAMKQVASYPTAAAVIPWKYLGKALLKGGRNGRVISRADVDLINQYTPLYQMRREGQANEIASIMAKRGMEQKLPWLLGWITKMDVMTVGRLWSAAEYMVADQQNLPVGSDEYYKAVAKVFNDTIQQTQPNFTPLQRNAALRSKNPIVRSLVLFGTQRMQNGGILMEAAYELKHSKGKSKAEIQAAKQKLGRAVASQIVQNILLIVASLGVDALRGRMKSWQDEDKDITPESLAKGMSDMFLSNFIGSFLGGSETYSLFSGLFKKAMGETAYDTEFTVPALDAVETLINFAQSDVPSTIKYLLGDHTDEEKQKKAINFSYQLAKAFGYATGIPLENALKDVFKGIIPAIEDISDAIKTGELNLWLHQSGKLDKAKTAANYKEWTKAGFSGRDYFYYEKMMSDVKGGREGRIPVLLQSDLTNEQKAMLMRMFDASGATSDGTKVYAKNGDLVIDFANPTEKQQALPMPTTETEETAAPTTTPTVTPKPTENPLTDARQEGVKEAVAKGVPEQTAFDAFIAYQNMGKSKSDDYSRNDDFRAWLFKNVQKPEERAILEYQVIGQASKVEGAVTYRDSGVVYRDYTNESWFKLSEHNLSKDGTNKRYEAGKRLEKTGLSVEKTVAIYDGLKDLTKKSEWTEYLKKQGLTDEQINIFLWSRGWAK